MLGEPPEREAPPDIPRDEVATEVHLEPLPRKTFPFVGVPVGIVEDELMR